MPNPNQNDDRMPAERIDVDESGVDADDSREARQPQRVNQADEAIEEQQDDDPSVDPDDELDDEDEDDLDEGGLDGPGVQRG